MNRESFRHIYSCLGCKHEAHDAFCSICWRFLATPQSLMLTNVLHCQAVVRRCRPMGSLWFKSLFYLFYFIFLHIAIMSKVFNVQYFIAKCTFQTNLSQFLQFYANLHKQLLCPLAHEQPYHKISCKSVKPFGSMLVYAFCCYRPLPLTHPF